MSATGLNQHVPEDFRRAVASMRAARPRPEIALSDGPVPRTVAPYAATLEADMVMRGDDLGSGRFTLLYDPEGRAEWQGVLRVTAWLSVDVEPELAADPLLAEVAWSWLTDGLADADAQHHLLTGTVTREMTQWFGEADERQPTLSLDIRTSWTPTTLVIGPHVHAWLQTLCQMGGLPPLPPGVSAIGRR